MIRRLYVDTPGGQVHVRRSGDGSPIVLLHQSPSSGAMWEPVFAHLAASGFGAIAPDMQGHGNSFRPAAPPAIADYAACMVAVMDALGLERVDLVGHHTGALVAAQIAADYPDRVRKLVLWGLAMYVDALRASRERLKNERPPDYDVQGNELVSFWSRQRSLAGEAFTAELGVRAMIEMLQTGSARPWGHWAGQQCEREAVLARVAHPALVMGGERDPLWPGIEAAASLIPHARFHVLRGAGLYVTDEFPEEFARLVTQFLET
ncbi:MAG: hypothetical protein A3G25_05130 [Betaproteobacteria bacterium RIFCSPLOWO2_12_FULL_63_13]|nr:MAG: hypothetical protein A3H32_01985 [Betaproteobacteria bacterium RIFCSPLOWO2_02_FULL_63_19]OGA53913.1 MAG: hypothetical protein A3G25_05130 [Betaproteobacteria bacterium RIFCSPLOWO2_12_FULL_63_13]